MRFGALRDFIISSSVGLPIPISFDFSSILISLSVCLSLSEPKSSIDSCKLSKTDMSLDNFLDE